MSEPRTEAGRALLGVPYLKTDAASESVDLAEAIVAIESEAAAMAGAAVANLQLTDDHEMCETQISELTAVLADVMRAKSFDTLTIALRDRVRAAIKTRGITVNR